MSTTQERRCSCRRHAIGEGRKERVEEEDVLELFQRHARGGSASNNGTGHQRHVHPVHVGFKHRLISYSETQGPYPVQDIPDISFLPLCKLAGAQSSHGHTVD